jgi:hypothetical protein
MGPGSPQPAVQVGTLYVTCAAVTHKGGRLGCLAVMAWHTWDVVNQ